MIAHKQDNSFSKLSHKCTEKEDFTGEIKNKRGDSTTYLVTSLMILNAPFQVHPGSMTWELHAFQADTNRISWFLKVNKKYQKQF